MALLVDSESFTTLISLWIPNNRDYSVIWPRGWVPIAAIGIIRLRTSFKYRFSQLFRMSDNFSTRTKIAITGKNNILIISPVCSTWMITFLCAVLLRCTFSYISLLSPIPCDDSSWEKIQTSHDVLSEYLITGWHKEKHPEHFKGEVLVPNSTNGCCSPRQNHEHFRNWYNIQLYVASSKLLVSA